MPQPNTKIEDNSKTIKMSMKKDEEEIKDNHQALSKLRALKKAGLPVRMMCAANKPHLIKKYHLPPDNNYKMVEFQLPKNKLKEELLAEIAMKSAFKTIKEIEHKYGDGTKVLRLIVEI